MREESICAVSQQNRHLEMLLYFVAYLFFVGAHSERLLAILLAVYFGIYHFFHGLIQLMIYLMATFLRYAVI